MSLPFFGRLVRRAGPWHSYDEATTRIGLGYATLIETVSDLVEKNVKGRNTWMRALLGGVFVAVLLVVVFFKATGIPLLVAYAYVLQQLPRSEPHYGDPASPINAAASRGDVGEVRRLVSANPRQAKKVEGYPRTAVMVAAMSGRTDVLEAILKDDGWDVNAAIFAHSPQTAVDFAAAEGQADAVTWLLQRGAKLHSSKEVGDESRLAMLADYRSMDPVRRVGLVRVARLYIDRGENVNQQLYSSRATPLHLAARQSFPEMIELLVSRGANVSMLDEYGRTPLDVANTAGCAECVARLGSPHSRP